MAYDPNIIEAQWKPVTPPTRRPGRPAQRRPVADGILADRWPALAAAMGQYQQTVAEAFTREAYEHVTAGIIRLDARRHLAARAAELDIRPFDAQLLIACAVRQWALDREAVGVSGAPVAPGRKAWPWRRLAWLVLTAAALDAALIWGLGA